MNRKIYQQPKAVIFSIKMQKMIANTYNTHKTEGSAQEEAYGRGSSGNWDDEDE